MAIVIQGFQSLYLTIKEPYQQGTDHLIKAYENGEPILQRAIHVITGLILWTPILNAIFLLVSRCLFALDPNLNHEILVPPQKLCKLRLEDISGDKWLDNSTLSKFFDRLASDFPGLAVPKSGLSIFNLDNLEQSILNPNKTKTIGIEDSTPKNSAFYLSISSNHWTLVFTDHEKRTVEYYDSFVSYGDQKKIKSTLNSIAKKLSKNNPAERDYQVEHKIDKALQKDCYQCGIWVVYFLENRLKNSEVNFNEMDIAKAQEIIAQYRLELNDYLKKENFILMTPAP